MLPYENFKSLMVQVLGLSKDAIHVHVGVLLFLFWAIIFKKPLSHKGNLIPVFMIALGMEIMDLSHDYLALVSIDWVGSLHDLINTVILPVLIWLAFKFRLLTYVNPS
ncbi:hypothetical protein BVY03_05295 [bacterium K02(2017)]|nr:hypothetical protein BVY03_05295 [bacterium K02(2017)]